VITRIQALNFRCLRYIDQPLSGFHVLVGPNASGKTTFLDIISFLAVLVGEGIDEAVQTWTRNFQDLVWGREGNSFELAVEARIPEN
jgi:predicted ATPase